MRIILPLTLLLGSGGLAAAAPVIPSVPPVSPPAAASGRAVQAGVAVDFTAVEAGGQPGQKPGQKPAELREGKTALFRFRISDTATGTPVAGASPAGWVDFTPDAQVEAKSCGDRVGELISGSLLARPEVDLNTYHVLALNEDSTISVIDPLLGFGGTKLLAMVFLDGPGEDWVLAKDGNRLFVSVPNADQIAVVDTVAWKVVAKVPVGPRPGRLALQADGTALWTTLEDGAVAVVDTAHLTVAARIPTGAGRHEIVLADDGRLAWVTNREARTLSVIDALRRVKLRDVPLGAPPTAVAWSPLARMAYVTSEEAGTVVAVGETEKGPGVVARMTAEPGLGAIRFAPGGRLGFVVVPQSHRLLILDSARNRIVQTATLEHAPERVTFSDHLAYVRQRDSEVVLMVPLEQVGEEGKAVPVVDFPGGEHALGDVLLPSPADSIVRAPGGTAVLVANPGDKAIFYYKEGMAAPVGSFQNYSRQPRAVLVVDRSLRERAPGVYEAEARLPPPGRYQVAFFLDAPRAVHCFPLTVTLDPAQEEERARRAPARVESLVDAGRALRAGETVHLRFRISDPRTKAPKDGLQDVVMMIYQAAASAEWRQAAKPAGDGVYEMEFTPPAAGTYHVAVECPSQNLPFHLSPPVILRVTEGKAAAAP
jgi:DNA-binding beta-propeller fold protein YncE